VVTAGDHSLIVSATSVFLGEKKGFFRSGFGDFLIREGLHGATALGIRLVNFDCHFFSPIVVFFLRFFLFIYKD
jgi:hypothetical protein